VIGRRVTHNGRPAVIVDYHALHVALRRHWWSRVYWASIFDVEPVYPTSR
jgi:hypothetical protein